jgi:hypothetical protein
MDGCTGFKTAAAEAVPGPVAVMDPFHVVAVAGDALDRCRQRVQQDTRGHRGRTGDPLYSIRRGLRTGTELLTGRQRSRLDAVFTDDRHLAVQVSWQIYQRIVAAYRNPDRLAAKTALTKLITTIGRGVPAQLPEVATLGRTLTRRATDVLAYFDRPGHLMGRRRRSTAVSNTFPAPPSVSATSPTTSPDHYSKPAASDHNYTLDSDEPLYSGDHRHGRPRGGNTRASRCCAITGYATWPRLAQSACRGLPIPAAACRTRRRRPRCLPAEKPARRPAIPGPRTYFRIWRAMTMRLIWLVPS